MTLSPKVCALLFFTLGRAVFRIAVLDFFLRLPADAFRLFRAIAIALTRVTWVSIMGSRASRKREIQSLSVQTCDESRGRVDVRPEQASRSGAMAPAQHEIAKHLCAAMCSLCWRFSWLRSTQAGCFDQRSQRCPLLGVKRTCPIALQMSASDPKRTFVKVALEQPFT